MPIFSIITINFNDAVGLKRTIDSVISQSFTNYEYIIIDGGSTDGSAELIHKYADKLSHWVSEKDAGIFDAMNKGIALAKGEYCLFLNSGDYFYQNDVLQKFVESKLSADIIYGDVVLERDGVFVSEVKSPENLSTAFLLVATISHQAQFIKRTLFAQLGHYSRAYKMSSDYDFFIKAYHDKNIQLEHVPLAISVFDLSGMSSNPANSDLFYRERKLIIKSYFPRTVYLAYLGYAVVRRSTFINTVLASFPFKQIKHLTLKFMGETNKPL